MTLTIRRIGRDDADGHERFHRFVPLTFRSVDFRRWDQRGGWNDDYVAWLLLDGDESVASIGLTRMRLVLAGEHCEGYQLGAVATHPQHRGHGHSRVLLDAVLAHIDAQAAPALLFANYNVLGFYPRFGFRAVTQRRFAAEIALRPMEPAPRADMAEPAARERLAQHCAQAFANDTGFGARDYYSVLLWHLTYRPITAYWLDDGHAFAAVERQDDTLVLHDLIATRPFDLSAALPQVLDAPVARIDFGFSPRAWWPEARDIGACDGSPLFVRAMEGLGDSLRFPDLAQT